MTEVSLGHAADSARRLRLSAPRLSARVSAGVSASVLARLVASGTAVTRAELTRETGLARSTVALGLSSLQRIGLLDTDGAASHQGRGRPGERLRIAAGFGRIVTAEIDLERTRVAVFDFGQALIDRFDVELSTDGPPGVFAERLSAAILAHLADAVPQTPVRIVVVAVPGPVDTRRGTIVRPPLLPGWDDYPLAAELERHLGCAVVSDNDADLRALGEARSLPETDSPLLYVRVDSGIGAGFMDATAELYVGADGAAGDIGHMRTGLAEGRRCRCGQLDHLEAHGSVTAMVQRWDESPAGRAHPGRAGFEEALRAREPRAVDIARDAAKIVGHALSDILLMFNPARISVGGSITDVSDVILAGIRSVVYETGLPLATRNLTISASEVGEDVGLQGGLVLGLERTLGVTALTGMLDAANSRERRVSPRTGPGSSATTPRGRRSIDSGA